MKSERAAYRLCSTGDLLVLMRETRGLSSASAQVRVCERAQQQQQQHTLAYTHTYTRTQTSQRGKCAAIRVRSLALAQHTHTHAHMHSLSKTLSLTLSLSSLLYLFRLRTPFALSYRYGRYGFRMRIVVSDVGSAVAAEAWSIRAVALRTGVLCPFYGSFSASVGATVTVTGTRAPSLPSHWRRWNCLFG